MNEDDIENYWYERGFPLGVVEVGDTPEERYRRINNHIRFNVKFHRNEEEFQGIRIVGFEAEPLSVKHMYTKWDGVNTKLSTCQIGMRWQPQYVDSPGVVVWTYDVNWEASDIKWASRWDIYLKAGPEDQIHILSIVNSLMIVIFLSGMVAMIMVRTLHRDLAKYNEQTIEDAQEETGWKLVHADVFRPPRSFPMFFSAIVGSGVQVFAMTVTTMIFAVLGFMSPANRGGLMTSMLLLFVFMGSFAGYYSARIYKARFFFCEFSIEKKIYIFFTLITTTL